MPKQSKERNRGVLCRDERKCTLLFVTFAKERRIDSSLLKAAEKKTILQTRLGHTNNYL